MDSLQLSPIFNNDDDASSTSTATTLIADSQTYHREISDTTSTPPRDFDTAINLNPPILQRQSAVHHLSHFPTLSYLAQMPTNEFNTPEFNTPIIPHTIITTLDDLYTHLSSTSTLTQPTITYILHTVAAQLDIIYSTYPHPTIHTHSIVLNDIAIAPISKLTIKFIINIISKELSELNT